MLDLDYFKAYNDTYGHPAGDEMLQWVGSILRTAVRGHDIVARFGGEEFVVLLPATDEAEALEAAERLRSAVAGRLGPHGQMTASLGVGTAVPGTPSAAALVEQADRAMYQSKQAGRNQVTHYRDCANPAAPTTARTGSNHPGGPAADEPTVRFRSVAVLPPRS